MKLPVVRGVVRDIEHEWLGAGDLYV